MGCALSPMPGIISSQVVLQKPKPSRSHGSAEPLQSLQLGSAHHCLPAGSGVVPTCLGSVALKHRPSMTGMKPDSRLTVRLAFSRKARSSSSELVTRLEMPRIVAAWWASAVGGSSKIEDIISK
eukprot:scaffold95233_cov74-Phaeocystis_antarctica.AAC.5